MEADSKVKQAIIAWEKFRLIYNGVLLVVGLVLLMLFYHDLGLDDWVIAADTVAVAFLANLFFFLGPLGEIYSLVLINWQWSKGQRNGLFAIGLVFSCLVFFATVSATAFFNSMPNQ